jgi:hypothetical protein
MVGLLLSAAYARRFGALGVPSHLAFDGDQMIDRRGHLVTRRPDRVRKGKP